MSGRASRDTGKTSGLKCHEPKEYEIEKLNELQIIFSETKEDRIVLLLGLASEDEEIHQQLRGNLRKNLQKPN